MKKIFLWVLMAAFITAALPWLNAQNICNNSTGTHGDYIYQYWRDNGSGCMELGPDGTFSVEWSDVNNMILLVGIENVTGSEVFKYAADYKPEGNSYLGVYGYMLHPSIEKLLIDFQIIDSWGSWTPVFSKSMGTIESDGDIYNIYYYRQQVIAEEGPGYTDHYYSVRQNKRDNGNITLANHLKAWEALDIPLTDLRAISFFVEGYQSSGYAHVHELSITQGEPTPQPPAMGDVNGDLKINIIDALLVTQFYTGIKVETFFKANADVNHDDEITIIDALLIAQCYVEQGSCDF